ncbi:MAG: hypothetical protein GYA57_12335 [Myxococcales bacterium]|nr:hypothetical protein [Myxococcales bacterium]
MNCPRCGADMSEDAPCPKCATRVRHLRFGSDPDYFHVRRVRLDTPAGLRPVAGGLPRLRRGEGEDPRVRLRFYAVVGVAALLVALAAAVFVGLGDGPEQPSGPAPLVESDAAARDVAVSPPRSLLPEGPPVVLPVPGLSPAAPVPVGPPPAPAPGIPAVPVEVPLPPAPIPAPPAVAAPAAPPGLPALPPAVQQLAVTPSMPTLTNCSPTPCRVEERGWTVADRARDLLETDPALAACWAEETVRQGRKFNVPAMVSSGYFHLGLAYRAMGCRERAYGAFLSSLCEGRASVRPSLLEGYLGHCRRLGDGCDQPCRDERYIVSEQPLYVPPPAPAPTPAPAPSDAPAAASGAGSPPAAPAVPAPPPAPTGVPGGP